MRSRERILAMARERAAAYAMRKKKGSAPAQIEKEYHDVELTTGSVPLSAAPPSRLIESVPDVASLGASAIEPHINAAETKSDEIDTDLRVYLDKIKKEHPMFKDATLYGEACEDWAADHLKCRQCGEHNWKKMPRNHPGFDLLCKNCETRYQIKGTKRGHIQTRKGKCKIMGATYEAVSKCSKEGPLDYYLFD